ncbi:MAG: hypothetical protein OXE77_08645 [Flavobacteriaceae bacterium]|nr:hypothetical protein [Flavobacteriaceae bacterium]MCY4267283.1 hypothetical protein [Flavobacteriaceae bacterium]
MIKFLPIVLLLVFPKISHSQIDTIIDQTSIESIKQEINEKLDSLIFKNIELSSSIENRIEFHSQQLNRIYDSIQIQKFQSESISDSIIYLNSQIKNISNRLIESNARINQTSSKIDSRIRLINKTLKANLLRYLFFLSVLLSLVIIMFFILKKNLKSDNSVISQKINQTSKKLECQLIELDKRLVDFYTKDLKNEEHKTANREKDHTLSLKVADEIIRMLNNINHMSDETRGVKQLKRSIQRMKETFKNNDYEIVEMLGKSYNEGMSVIANFIPDDNLRKGQQIITRIIKPQVNFNGVMIQAAQIEVSNG